MDPASCAITFISAAAHIARGIKALKEAKKLPAEFSLLLAEVDDLHFLLHQCYTFSDSHKHLGTRFEETHFVEHSKVAKAKLEDLSTSLQEYVQPTGLGSPSQRKAYWQAVRFGKSRLSEIRDELRDLRCRLADALQLLSGPVLFGLEKKVDSVLDAVTTLTEQVTRLSLPPDCTLQQTSSVNIAGDIVVQIEASKTESITPMTVKKPAPPAYSEVKNSSVSRIAFPPDNLGRFCKPFCSCRCHHATTLEMPKSLQCAFGSLTLTHKGLPGLTKDCDQKFCRRRVAPKMTVTYRFSSSWLQRKVITATISTLAGPEFTVKLPRIVDWTSPIWQHATAGNVNQVRALWQSGLASPWDVSPLGGNLLHYATDHWNPELCELLIEEAGLDPEAEDNFKNTGVSIAWERVLSGQMSADDGSRVASLFRKTDYLSSRQFTIVHKIVLGITSIDLAEYLEGSTAEIDKKDSRGRTALSWASARGDDRTVATLLRYHADPNISDVCQFSPLHYAQNTACAQLLLEHGADLYALNQEGQTPLYTACRNIGSASLTTYLIEAGSILDTADYSDQTALHAALSNGKHLPFIDVLVANGANINARNNSGDSPLLFAVMHNMHDLLLQMLKSGRADFAGINNYGHSFAHAIARTADAETVRILKDARPKTLSPDMALKDRSGKTPVDHFEERLALLPPRECEELRMEFDELVRAFTDVSDDGDAADDVFEGVKSDLYLRVTEIEDDLRDDGVWHDAVESF